MERNDPENTQYNADAAGFRSSLVSSSWSPSVTFTGSGKLLLRISAEGVMTIGDGLSKDEATQEAAAMLMRAFASMHETEMAKLKMEIAELKANLAGRAG